MEGYEKYSKQIEDVTDRINLKMATTTERKGGAKARDGIVFGKMVWSEAFSYISPLQTAIIFTALITPSVMTVNVGLQKIGEVLGIANPFQFPIDLVAVFAIIAILGIFIFGFVSVRHIGTYKRSNELTAKMNPATYLIWEKLEKLEEKMEELNDKHSDRD